MSSWTFLLATIYLAAWELLTESYRHPGIVLWDMVAVLLGLIIFLLLVGGRWRRVLLRRGVHGTSSHSALTPTPNRILALLLTLWISISLFDSAARRPALHAADDRSTRYAAASDGAASNRTTRIGLALSGGGYRAALFHVGVLNSLESLDVPVTNISAVSGGAIIAAYVSRGGTPGAFATAVKRGAFNLKRELALVHNFLPWMWPWAGVSRADIQAGMVRRLLGAAATNGATAPPLLIIGATDVNYGFQVGVAEDGLLLHSRDHSVFYREGISLKMVRSWDWADRVAASGAFPIAFPARELPIEVKREELDLPVGRFVKRRLLLIDGGVADNTGVTLLQRAAEVAAREQQIASEGFQGISPLWKVDVILGSDAGALFHASEQLSTVDTFSRAFDVGVQLAAAGAAQRPDSKPPVLTLGLTNRSRSAAQNFNHPKEVLLPDDVFLTRVMPNGFDPRIFPTRILQKIAALFPENKQSDLVKLIDRLDLARLRAGLWPVPGRQILNRLPIPSQFKTPQECWGKFAQQGEGSVRDDISTGCFAAEIRIAVRDQMNADARIFRTTSTLQDQIVAAQGDALIRLGSLQVLLDWPRLMGAVANGTQALQAKAGAFERVDHTAMCDASAGVSLDRDHFVAADDERNVLRIYRRSQRDPVADVPLESFLATEPGKESDVEGAAAIGTRIYWISSHGRNSEGKAQSRRHRLFATEIRPGPIPAVTPVGQPYENLQRDILAAPALQSLGLANAANLAPEAEGGFNIEGLAATPDGQLLVGFRNPVSQGAALLVPIENPAELVAGGNVKAKLGAQIHLNLGDRGIRSIERVGSDYFVVAGPTADAGTFAVYRWSGKAGDAPQLLPDMDLGDFRPEALFAIPGTPSLMLLSDDGSVVTDGTRCKDKAAAERSFHSIVTPR